MSLSPRLYFCDGCGARATVQPIVLHERDGLATAITRPTPYCAQCPGEPEMGRDLSPPRPT